MCKRLEAMLEHNFLHLLAVFMATVTFNVTILFTSGALGHRLGLFTGLFSNSTGSGLADKYYLEKYRLDVTPAEWSFYMAVVIYFWQSLWLTYGTFNVCRKTDNGYMYMAFPVMPPILYVVFSFSLACNISWLLIWDREYMEVALVFVNLMSCTLYICLVVALRRLYEFGTLMASHNLMREIWLHRILVQNGLAMFAFWGTVASMFNFAVVLTYRTGAKQEVASTVSLSIFTLEIVAWFIFDNFVFEKYMRFVFTPYVILLTMISGIVSNNWKMRSTNAVYTLLLLIIVVILSIAKVILVIWRHKKTPLFQQSSEYRRPTVSFEVRGLLNETPLS